MSATTLVDIVEQLYEKAAPAQAIVPLDQQTALAFLAIISALFATGAFVTNVKGKTPKLALLALIASLGYAFGAVFTVNAVRVYTG